MMEIMAKAFVSLIHVHSARSDSAILQQKLRDNVIAWFSDISTTVQLFVILNTSLRLQDQNAL